MLAQLPVAGVVHVAQVVAAVVVAIDVERLVIFARIADGHAGFVQPPGQFLVFAVVVRAIATDAIEGVFAKRPAAVIEAIGVVFLQAVAVLQQYEAWPRPLGIRQRIRRGGKPCGR